MLNWVSLLRFAPWVAIAILAAWFWWRGERIDKLQANNRALSDRLTLVELQAEQLRAAVDERMRNLARIEESANETAAIIEQSFSQQQNSNAAYLPGDVYRRLRRESGADAP